LRQPLEKYEHLEKRWGVMFEGIKINSKANTYFYFFFVVRRLVFVNLAFFVYKYPSFQIIGVIFLNTFMLIYQGLNRPLIERLKNNIELVNEFCITNVSI
jgi:hypothetical protein